jgi:hypothetical protein
LSVANSSTSTGTEAWQSEQPAAIYRLYDAGGQLLYIGSSHQPAVRQQEHRKKPWGGEIARREDRWYRNRAVAYAEETAAIQAELPKYNLTDNPAALPSEPDDASEEVQRVSDALEAVDGIADLEERVRARNQVLALQAQRVKDWHAERRDLVLAMRAEDPPVTIRAIAARLDMSPGVVQDIIRGHTGSWKNREKKQEPPDG